MWGLGIFSNTGAKTPQAADIRCFTSNLQPSAAQTPDCMRFQAHQLASTLHGHGHTSFFWPVLLFLGVLLLVLKLVTRKWGYGKHKHSTGSFLPWDQSMSLNSGLVIVVDCTHPKAPTFSHHKGHRNPHGLKVSSSLPLAPRPSSCLPQKSCTCFFLAELVPIFHRATGLVCTMCRRQTLAPALCSTHLQQTASL